MKIHLVFSVVVMKVISNKSSLIVMKRKGKYGRT